MLKFLWDWRYVILFVLWAIITCIIKGKDWRDKKIHEYMLAAKQMSTDGFLKDGQAQEDWVVDNIYILFQRLKIPFINKDNIRYAVKKLYNLAMDKMDNGKIDNSFKAPTEEVKGDGPTSSN